VITNDALAYAAQGQAEMRCQDSGGRCLPG